MSKVSISLTFDISSNTERDMLNNILRIAGGSVDAAPTLVTQTKSRSNNPYGAPKGVNTMELRKQHMTKVVDILSSIKGNGAFIYADLFRNRDKYGLNVSNSSSLYKVIDNLVKDGKVRVIRANNPATKNTMSMQEYVQLV